jgi:hypothetical protein
MKLPVSLPLGGFAMISLMTIAVAGSGSFAASRVALTDEYHSLVPAGKALHRVATGRVLEKDGVRTLLLESTR